MFKKRSFFQKLTGGLSLKDMEDESDFLDDRDDLPRLKRTRAEEDEEDTKRLRQKEEDLETSEWNEVEDEMTSELAVDVYQTPEEIVVKAFAAGVKPEDLDIDISRDMVTVSGSRKEGSMTETADYISRELFWGSFSRTVMLPEEVDPEQALATEKNGLVIIRLPKLDKKRRTKLRVKSR